MEPKHETNRGSVWLEEDQVLNKGGKMRHILLIKRGLASCSSAALWQSEWLELNTQNTGGHEEQPTGFLHCNHEKVRQRVKKEPPTSESGRTCVLYVCMCLPQQLLRLLSYFMFESTNCSATFRHEIDFHPTVKRGQRAKGWRIRHTVCRLTAR